VQATPVLSGRTEPPGRLPSCARLPSHECITGHPRLSPVLPGFHRAFFILSAPGLAWAHLRLITPPQLCGVLGKHATPVRKARTAPPGRLHPCTRTPIATSRIPRRYQALLRRLRIPPGSLSPHGSRTRVGQSVVVSRRQFRGLLRFASYPCPLRPDRAPWPPSLQRQALRYPKSPRLAVLATRRSDSSFPLSVPGVGRSLTPVLTQLEH